MSLLQVFNYQRLASIIAAHKEEKAHYEEQLVQAQGKVVLLAASLNGMWTLLGEHGERMGEWTASSSSLFIHTYRYTYRYTPFENIIIENIYSLTLCLSWLV